MRNCAAVPLIEKVDFSVDRYRKVRFFVSILKNQLLLTPYFLTSLQNQLARCTKPNVALFFILIYLTKGKAIFCACLTICPLTVLKLYYSSVKGFKLYLVKYRFTIR